MINTVIFKFLIPAQFGFKFLLHHLTSQNTLQIKQYQFKSFRLSMCTTHLSSIWKFLLIQSLRFSSYVSPGLIKNPFIVKKSSRKNILIMYIGTSLNSYSNWKFFFFFLFCFFFCLFGWLVSCCCCCCYCFAATTACGSSKARDLIHAAVVTQAPAVTMLN